MAKDKTYLTGFNQIRLPKLKGEVKITLHNPTTGKNEVVEGENIITNAVRDIYLNNYLGQADYNKTMPLWSNWFGGVLCYENAFTVDSQTGKPDPDDYFIQGEAVNSCVAHAGGSVIPTEHDDDLLRGSPTTSAFQYTATSVKQVWEWLPSHGNSNKNISAISLTHKDTGDAGIGTPYWAFQNFTPFVDIKSAGLENTTGALNKPDNINIQFDDNHGLFFHIGESTDVSVWNNLQTDKLTVCIRKLPYFKAGLYETVHADMEYEETFTVTLSFNLYANPCYWFDYENKKLWIFSNVTGWCAYSKTTINYAVIDCESEDVDSEGTIVSDDNDLMAMPMVRNASFSEIYNPNIVREGNYFYFPTSSGANYGNNVIAITPNLTGYKKINITNQADQTFLEFNATHQRYEFSTKCGGLILTEGQVFNGVKGYACQVLSQNEGNTHAISQPNKISTYTTPMYSQYYGYTQARHILACKMVNTSKWNLPTPVQKSASQSMAIEYTLTEVDPDEE